MIYKDFDAVIEQAKAKKRGVRVAVIEAGEEHTLDAATQAWRDGIIKPVLIGNSEKIFSLLKDPELKEAVIHTDSPQESAETAVRLVREGKIDFLMKGLAETSTVLKAILNRETGIRTGRTISQITLIAVSTYHKLLCVTDPAIVALPTLEKKKDIVQNAVDVLQKLGYERPKVAALCAIEKVNPDMIETVDAEALSKMVDAGEITGCEFEGPISADIAFDAAAAKIKGYQGSVCGDPDLLLMPTLAAGNILCKAMRQFAGSINVGVMVGAKVPMVLVSRSTNTKSKYTSLAVVSEMV